MVIQIFKDIYLLHLKKPNIILHNSIFSSQYLLFYVYIFHFSNVNCLINRRLSSSFFFLKEESTILFYVCETKRSYILSEKYILNYFHVKHLYRNLSENKINNFPLFSFDSTRHFVTPNLLLIYKKIVVDVKKNN